MSTDRKKKSCKRKQTEAKTRELVQVWSLKKNVTLIKGQNAFKCQEQDNAAKGKMYLCVSARVQSASFNLADGSFSAYCSWSFNIYKHFIGKQLERINNS